MFTQILVPLDGSALAERALPCAERLARATGATLHLVRVAGPIFAPTVTAEQESSQAAFLAAEMRTAEAYLERTRTLLEGSGLPVRARRVAGTITGALLDYAREEGIDLIVMSSHGQTGLARFPLGSIAAQVVRHGTTPVLLVRPFGPPPDLARVVVPLDGSPRAEAALCVVAALRSRPPGAGAPVLARDLTLLRVVDSQEEGVEAERYLAERTQQLAHEGGGPADAPIQRQVVQGDPATAILAAAGAQGLIVMATHGRSALTRWALGSVADRVTGGGAAAVLLVRLGSDVSGTAVPHAQVVRDREAPPAAPHHRHEPEETPHAAIQQLLVPLDGSELAARALPTAMRLAAALGATLHLVRVVEPPPAPARLHVPLDVYDAFVHDEMAAARDDLAAVRTRLSADGAGVRTCALLGDPASALLDYERAAGIDLVVLCSHGRGGVARLVLGSVAEHLLHEGTTPLLLVRAFGPSVALERTLVPLDGSVRAEAALDMVGRLAPGLAPAVTLLRVIGQAEEGPEAERYLAEVAARLVPADLRYTRQVRQGDPAEEILAVAGGEELVVMATHGRSGVLRWALGSVADRVAHGGAAGVLLVRAQASTSQRASDH